MILEDFCLESTPLEWFFDTEATGRRGLSNVMVLTSEVARFAKINTIVSTSLYTVRLLEAYALSHINQCH